MDKRFSLIFLSLLCFSVADVRDGLGPFIGIYLQKNGFKPDEIGFIMSLSGLAGIIFSSILGIVTDKTKYKRAMLAVFVLLISLSSFIILLSPSFTAVSFAQVMQGIAAAGIAPLITALTLGLTDKDTYAKRFSRNEAWNHTGNVTTSILSGVFGYYYGIIPVFIIMSIMAFLSALFTLLIKREHIDYDKARGFNQTHESMPLKDVILYPPLIMFGVILFFFHFGNAAILPLLGQSASDEFKNINPVLYTALTVVVAQITMIITSIIALKYINNKGALNKIILAALLALPVRALITGYFHSPASMVFIQILDGIGAGFLGVALPVVVSKILSNTGRINAGMGFVMTLHSIGAALSTSYAGVLAEKYSYSTAFFGLGLMAFIALMLYITACRIFKEFRF